MDAWEVEYLESTTEKHGLKAWDLIMKEIKGPNITDLYPHQLKATKEVTEMARESDVLLVAPTGSGKTGIIALLPYTLRAHKTMILTPSPTLSKQMKLAIGYPFQESSFWARAKIFRPSVPLKARNDFLPQVQVVENTTQLQDPFLQSDIVIVNAHKFGANSSCSIKKLHQGKSVPSWLKDSLAQFFESFDLLIVDEAHHFPAPIWKDIVQEYRKMRPNGRIIFVTATPYRHVNGKLRQILGPESCFQNYHVSKEELADNVLRPLVFSEREDPCVDSHKSIPAIKRLADDVFKELENQEKVEDRFMHQGLVIVEGVQFAKDVACIFNQHQKYPNMTVPIVGGYDLARKEIEKFIQGQYRVGIICRMLCEGFDLPNISVCVIYRNVRSPLLFQQFVGRSLRKFKFPPNNYGVSDRTKAMLMSYKRFHQRGMFVNLDKVVVEEYVDATVEGESEDEDEPEPAQVGSSLADEDESEPEEVELSFEDETESQSEEGEESRSEHVHEPGAVEVGSRSEDDETESHSSQSDEDESQTEMEDESESD